MRVFSALSLSGAALALLVACDTSTSQSAMASATGRGVGFSDYAQHLRAQDQLARQRQAQGGASQPPIGQQAVAAVRGVAPSTAPARSASPLPPQAQGSLDMRPTTVSEQTFTPRPFGSPQQNQLVERDFVPQVRITPEDLTQGAGTPNLFAFALSTTHNVGDQRYPRNNPLRWRRWETACARFPSQDLAQEAFLAAGGPQQDRNNLDPDGDGFACWWDPAPFRQAARTVRARQ
ncbi:MAG: hypothetical protein ACXIU7_12015 [Roseinatronobacter sp.]